MIPCCHPGWETAMAARGLAIRADVATAPELRRLAKKEPRRRNAQRMLAIANALDGMSRADAARAGGTERHARAGPGPSGRRAVTLFCASTRRGSRDWWTAPMAVGLSVSPRVSRRCWSTAF